MDFDRSWEALLQPEEATSYFDLWPDLPPFDPSLPGYRSANAWWLAEFSRLVYRRDPGDPLESSPQTDGLTRKNQLERVGWEEVDFQALPEAQFNILRPQAAGDRPFVVVAFRGTHDLEDVFTDLKVARKDWLGNTQVHAGFKDAYDEIAEVLASSLRPALGDVVFTGHSLGGALASLAATVRQPLVLYTFGCPLVGDPSFAALLSPAWAYRLVDAQDVVPTVPPVELGFAHGGLEHPLVSADPPSPAPAAERWLLDFLTRKIGIPKEDLKLAFPGSPPAFLSDHAPVNYVAAIEQEGAPAEG